MGHNNPHFIESCVFTIGDSQYAAYPSRNGYISDLPTGKSLVTAIPLHAGQSSLGDLVRTYVESALEADDVFCLDFLRGIVFFGDFETDDIPELEAANFPDSWNPSWTRFIATASDDGNKLSPGPYLLNGGSLWDVYRLYDDLINAFTIPFRPTTAPDEKLFRLSIQSSQHSTRSIAVPSRLHANESKKLPLSGLRITVKDMFQIEDFRTSIGSRAYLEFNPPATRTAPAIQKLIDSGAVIVGLTQLCSMVGTTDPTQCIDFQAPFNPRGDGYQSPSGGSNGQPSAIAAYEWLDIAIGSDSTISGRIPAQVNGCFSMRPTCGTISREGMWSGAPQFDTPCFFGRNIADFKRVATAWYGDKLDKTRRKNVTCSLVYLTDSLPDSTQQMDIFNSFVQDAEGFVNVRAQKISTTQLWNQQGPIEAAGSSLAEWLNEDIASRTYIYSFWKQIERFHVDYLKRFRKEPFMPPPDGINLWDRAKDVTPEQHLAALQRLQVYRDWLHNKVLQAESQHAVVVMPLREVKPNYRDEWPRVDAKAGQDLWEPLLLAPILGAPEIVIPIGQMAYESRISGRREYLPVCASMMGLPGSDLELIDLVHTLLAAVGRPTKVSTGKTMFEIH